MIEGLLKRLENGDDNKLTRRELIGITLGLLGNIFIAGGYFKNKRDKKGKDSNLNKIDKKESINNQTVEFKTKNNL